ncbi:hypothetical protein P5G61_02225 [Paenibacillus sp. F6_3S_P_1C]|uniref:Uncharacterized protein n=1 Tax=Paenibacillus vandeheii TaxID=3035917 RepID=A0ABT8J6Y8_9BACL|nr:hypothetical protein [Paenibacillus vandeheii]MDN4600029.1 hypothetical protein [Paenibacillus vandeheii]
MWIEQTFVLKSGYVVTNTIEITTDIETHGKETARALQKFDGILTFEKGKNSEGVWSIRTSEIAAHSVRILD